MANGKVVVITGAANGLGKALALELYSKSSHLALIDIDKQVWKSYIRNWI